MGGEAELIESKVIVPKDYLGICCANVLNVPDDWEYSTSRSWDYNATFGNSATCVATHINPAKDSFAWQTFDAFISAHLDKRVIFVLGAPPDYLVTRAALGGSYKGTKGNMCPDNLPEWAELVKTLVKRAKELFGKTGIVWQVWNEIDQSASYADDVALLGPYTRVTAQAIKQIDPTALVIGPPIAGANPIALPFMESYLAASDGAGGRAAAWLDGVAFHLYNQDATTASANESGLLYSTAFSNFSSLLSMLGLAGKPVYITETGVLSTDMRKIKILTQRAVVFAAMGAKLCLWYSYDGGTYAYTQYQAELNAAAALLAEGNIISSCVVGYGKLRVTINGNNHVID